MYSDVFVSPALALVLLPRAPCLFVSPTSRLFTHPPSAKCLILGSLTETLINIDNGETYFILCMSWFFSLCVMVVQRCGRRNVCSVSASLKQTEARNVSIRPGAQSGWLKSIGSLSALHVFNLNTTGFWQGLDSCSVLKKRKKKWINCSIHLNIVK